MHARMADEEDGQKPCEARVAYAELSRVVGREGQAASAKLTIVDQNC